MVRRLIAILLLGFSSGLPYALVGSTLQAWFAVTGIDITTVGMLGLIGQPYSYKFIWAPLVDRFAPNFLDRRRSWIAITQITIIGLLLLLSSYQPLQHAGMMALIAFLLAIVSASQDIVIDAYRTDLLLPDERGMGAAVAVAGYRIAMLLSGGVALALAQYYGWKFTYQLMASIMLLGVIANLVAPRVAPLATLPVNLYQTLLAPFTEFISRPYSRKFLLFIFMYKLAGAFTATSGGVSTPFLLAGLKFQLATVGLVNKVGGISAMLIGSFAAGFWMLRWPLYRALMIFGIAQAIANVAFWLLAVIGKSFTLLLFAVSLDNLCIGMSMTALVALIMSLCNHHFSATQFALLSAVAALPNILSGPIAGLLVPHCGWVMLYSMGVLLALPSLVILYYLRSAVIALNTTAR